MTEVAEAQQVLMAAAREALIRSMVMHRGVVMEVRNWDAPPGLPHTKMRFHVDGTWEWVPRQQPE